MLILIGGKMLLIDVYKIPVAWSLVATVTVLAVTMVLPLYIPARGYTGTARGQLAEWILNDQTLLDEHSVLHVLGPENRAARDQRRAGNHRIVNRQAILFRDL